MARPLFRYQAARQALDAIRRDGAGAGAGAGAPGAGAGAAPSAGEGSGLAPRGDLGGEATTAAAEEAAAAAAARWVAQGAAAAWGGRGGADRDRRDFGKAHGRALPDEACDGGRSYIYVDVDG